MWPRTGGSAGPRGRRRAPHAPEEKPPRTDARTGKSEEPNCKQSLVGFVQNDRCMTVCLYEYSELKNGRTPRNLNVCGTGGGRESGAGRRPQGDEFSISVFPVTLVYPSFR